jgi:Uma2 family endonuclease
MATATAPGSEVLVPPTEAEPEGRYEVVDGEVRQKPAMETYEADLAMVLANLLDNFGRLVKLGRAFMGILHLLDSEAKLQRRPDVSFVSADRWPLERRLPRGKLVWDVVPDLAVEVITPTILSKDAYMNIDQYFRAGVKQVWVVWPSVEKIYVYRGPKAVQVLSRGDTLEGGPVVPGFRVGLNELFGGD